MKKYFLLTVVCIIALGFAVSTFAKDPEFRVLGKKGNVQVQGKEINTGDAVNRNDKIVVKEASYLGLVHNTGRTVEISKPGTYSTATLAKNITSKGGSTSSKFASYVIDEISKPEDILTTKKYKRSATVAGSVERAEGSDVNVGESIFSMSGTNSNAMGGVNFLADVLFTTDKKFINVFLPRSSYLIDPQVRFSWYRNKEAKEYTLKITDTQDKEVYFKRLTDTSVSLNLDNIKLQRGANYYWSVKGDNDSRADLFCINLMSREDCENMQNEINSFTGEEGDSQDAVSKLIVAAYFEDANVMSGAVDAYRSALEIAPGVQSYKSLYARYLTRIGLTDEAKRVLK